ncbi:MAG: AAA family ATPase [Saprospiraceae bacterium]
MLVEFSVGNFWSFKDIQTLQMQAAKIKSKFPKVDEENVFAVSDKLSLLKSKAIYGANASGKSNLVRAFMAMYYIIKDNLSNPNVLNQKIIPFKFDEETVTQPSFFQLIFILENVQYRYGFEASSTEIITEWLFGKPLDVAGVRERYYFVREGNQVDVNEEWFKEGIPFTKSGDKTPPLFRNNSLFLTVVSAFNGTTSSLIVESISSKISIDPGHNSTHLASYSMEFFAENEAFKEFLNELLQSVDPTIRNIELVNMEQAIPDFPDKEKLLQTLKHQGQEISDIAVFRRIFNHAGKAVGQGSVMLDFQEAAGTKKIFALSSVIFLTMMEGDVLFIDELDAMLHPRLTRKIIQMFNSNKTNPNNAQLIFVTHDSTLLDAHLLRRDQITFTKKDKFGATELFSLTQFKGVRNDASFEKDYLLGKYGAVPNNLNIMEDVFENAITYAKKN